jgi:CRISPR-associated protein Cas2
MWMIVMFDLPVVEDDDRHHASRFRHALQDLGFCMAQYSVYYRVLSGKEAANAMTSRITAAAPGKGHVQILCITDKQYESIISLRGGDYEAAAKNEQLSLF